jgi:hypothetical protein
VLATDHGASLSRRRQAIVEPVFGQIKANRGADRFLRRGRSAVRSQWRLLATTHNLIKLHRHTLASAKRDQPDRRPATAQTQEGHLAAIAEPRQQPRL